MKMSENCTQMSLFPEMEESISSPVDSPARTFRLPEIRKELRQREVDSFSRLPGSPTRSSPIAELDPRLCWRTSQTCLLETGEVGQEPYMGSWPSEGIVLNGKLWEQSMWGHLTGGSDGGQSVTWPTPRVSDTEGGLVKNVEMENGSFSRKNKDGVRVYEEGQLNADWVEWLMGYPTGWTNLDTSPE